MGVAGRRETPAPPADPESLVAAEELALRILSAAAQPAAALRRRLERRGFSAAVAEEATATMVALGYVNDVAYAQAIAARRQRSGHGRIHVGAELRARGVDPDAVSAVLGDVDGDAERGAALALGRRLAKRDSRDLADRQQRQRLGATLQRRGFDVETVSWVLRRIEREV